MPRQKDGRRDATEQGDDQVETDRDNATMAASSDGQRRRSRAGSPAKKRQSRPRAGGSLRPQDVQPTGPGSGIPAQPREVQSVEQYLVAPRPRPFSPFEALAADNAVLNQLAQIPGVQRIRTIAPRGLAAVMSADAPPVPPIHVFRMPPDKARAIQQDAGQQLILEVDEPLTLADSVVPEVHVRDPGVIFPLDSSTAFSATLEVQAGGRPLPDATVYLYGATWPGQGVTDANGRVRITLHSDTAETIRGLMVKPARGYWTRWISRPQLDVNGVNTVTVKPLVEMFPNLQSQEFLGWGQRLMRLDQVRPDHRGQGVRVAIIDSGAASTTHQDLREISLGVDVQSGAAGTWNQDTIGHGSHCAGIICGSARNGRGVRGFAPDAEVHILKVFPRGSASDLADALQYCIEKDIDVVNLSLGMDANVSLLETLFAKARSVGIACIAAAGNSGGAVMFPARLPNVLAVSAIGRWGDFPEDSYHALQTADPSRRSGLFSARFTCFGPEVNVAGPGVAVVSSVPPDDFVAMDGTSMAAPHITGLAALVLAHHPSLRSMPRTAARVDTLFQILREAAQPFDLSDRNRIGAGVPDAVRALPQSAAAGAQAGAQPGAAPPVDQAALFRRLIEEALRGSPLGSQLAGGAGAFGQAPGFTSNPALDEAIARVLRGLGMR